MKPEIIYLPLSEIKPYENNPRYNESAVDAVAQSIKEFGFKNPIIVDKHKVIIAGHTRYKASQQLGLEEVPCIIASDLTDKQAKAYRLVDNKVGELAEWDFLKLGKEITGLPEYDFEGFGFDLQEIEDKLDLEKELVDDEYEIPETIETKVKKGEVWQLGRHRLMCGDSTDPEVVKKLVDGNIIDLVLTDPPYNCDYEGSDGQKIENDKMSDADFKQFMLEAFSNMYEHCKDGANAFVFHRDIEGVNFQGGFKGAGFKLAQMWIWVKNSATFGRGWAHYKHEPIMVGWKEGAPHYVTGDRTLTTILEYDKPKHNDLHPTMKPIELMSFLIKEGSRPGEKVLDLFGGSGTTLIACEQLNRQCNMMEYDEKYASVIVDRWEKFTGKVATKIC